MEYPENQAEVRELARKHGGEASVAKVDAAYARQAKFALVIQRGIDAIMDDANLEDAEEHALALATASEALSEAFAKSAIAYGNHQKTGQHDIIVTAIQSLMGNIHAAFADHKASEGGILDLIKKGWSKPSEGGEQ